MDMREVGISDVFFGEISHPGDKTKGVANSTKGFFFQKNGSMSPYLYNRF